MDNRKQHYFNFLLSSILAFKKKRQIVGIEKSKMLPENRKGIQKHNHPMWKICDKRNKRRLNEKLKISQMLFLYTAKRFKFFKFTFFIFWNRNQKRNQAKSLYKIY